MTSPAIRYNVEAKNRLGYGGAKRYVTDLLSGDAKNMEINTKKAGIVNTLSFYNACYQAARRSGLCKVSRDGDAVVIERV